MNIVLFCATRRGAIFLDELARLLPEGNLTVFSFRETPEEPPFLEDIRAGSERVGARFFKTKNPGSRKWKGWFADHPVDLMFAVSWRYLIPPEIYDRARLGAYVFHDSLLPEYRGFAPTLWAIINGEDHTGATLFSMAEKMDQGGIVDQERVAIGPDEEIASVMERVTRTYVALLGRNWQRLCGGELVTHPQDESNATYGCKRLPRDNLIDWNAPTETIHNLIRAVARPYPGAYTYFQGRELRVWSARRLNDFPVFHGRVPGRLVEVRPCEGSVILTGDGALLLERVQIENEPEARASSILSQPSHELSGSREHG